MKMKKSDLEVVVIILAICLLAGAIVYQGFGKQEDTLTLLQKVLPGAGSYESKGGKYPAFRVFDGKQKLLGYGVLAESSGYGGPIKVLVGINPAGEIIKIEIIEHRETQLYLQRVVDSGFLGELVGKSYSDSLSLNVDLDGVSGATVSSEGIALAVRRAINQIGLQEFGMVEKEPDRFELGIEEIILLILFGAVFVSVRIKTIRLRPVILVFSVIFLGFRLNTPLNLVYIASLISGNAPSFLERPFWFILVVGILLLVLIAGKNFYCTWLCPFGAVQEGIHKALCLVRYKVPERVLLYAGRIRLTLTWTALMIAFVFLNPSIACYEPFSAFFSGSANAGQWLIMGLVLLMSISINRLWCRFFCPTGAVMDLVASTRRIALRLFHTKAGRHENLVRDMCPVERGQKEIDGDASTGEEYDRVFLFILMGFVVLIMLTLLMNAGSRLVT